MVLVEEESALPVAVVEEEETTFSWALLFQYMCVK
jgi:hypothetical protein